MPFNVPPPSPPPPDVPIVDPRTGLPTTAFVQYQRALDAWLRRLAAALS